MFGARLLNTLQCHVGVTANGKFNNLLLGSVGIVGVANAVDDNNTNTVNTNTVNTNTNTVDENNLIQLDDLFQTNTKKTSRHWLGSLFGIPKKTPISDVINYQPIIRPSHNDSKFMVIGQTGSGKSTAVNVVANHFRGGDINNLKVIIPTKYMKATEPEGIRNSEYNVKDTTKAQTKKATEYVFKRHGKANISFIDTPGLNDTEGLTQDDKNLETILNAAICAPKLSGIILVINGSSARITHNITSMINKFKGSLPNRMMDNVIVIFTMCRESTCNFKDLEQLGISPRNVFYMNNTAFSSDPKTWNDMDKHMLSLEWNQSMDVCQNLETAMDAITPIATDEFLKIKTIRSDIKSALHKIRTELVNLQKITDEISIIQSNKNNADNIVDSNKDYTVKNEITVNELVPASYHSTICPKCTWACHDGCGLEFSSHPGRYFEHCSAMNGRYCTECPNKCPASDHYHAMVTMKKTTKVIDNVIDDMKNKYLSSLDDSQKLAAQLDEQTLIKKSIDKQINDLMEDIDKKCTELKQICNHFNIVDELKDLIYQLKQEAKLLTSLEARQLADETINHISDICRKFEN